MKKPKLSLSALILFYEIARYAKRYCKSVDGLRHAASDVMDGNYLGSDPEVKELKRMGLIESINVGDRWPNGGWTWHVTDHGIEAWSRIQFVPEYAI